MSLMPKARRWPIQPTTCGYCSTEFTPTDRAYRRRKAQFCSAKCWYASNRKPHFCAGCGKEVPRVSVFANKFCSHSCRVKHHGFRDKVRKEIPCQTCGKTFVQRTTTQARGFCSVACYSAHTQATRRSVGCVQCKKQFHPSNKGGKFCSPQCRSEYLKIHRHPLYRGGRSGDRGPTWKQEAAAIRRRDDFICQACGDGTGDKAHHVDHLVPYRLAKRIAAKADGLNPNDPINLLTLCLVCHMQKTSYERYILDGDVNGFFAWASGIVGRDPLRKALELFGLWPAEKGSKRA